MRIASGRRLSWIRAAGIGALLAIGTAGAAERPPGSITVEGEARTEVVPDMARLSLGVAADRPTAAAASAEVARLAKAVLAGFAADGIAPADMATTAIALALVDPDDGVRGPGRPPAPVTFRAATTFAVTVRPAERAGLVAAGAIDRGATSIADIGYASSREDALRDGLRADAVRDARRKAGLYAEALGVHLGPVLEVTPREDGVRPLAYAMRAAAPAPAPVAAIPTAPGTLSLQSGVAIRWALDP